MKYIEIFFISKDSLYEQNVFQFLGVYSYPAF